MTKDKKGSQRKSAPKQPILSNQPEPQPQSQAMESALQKQQQAMAEKRADKCWDELLEVAKKHNCTITAGATLTGDGRIRPYPMVVPE